MDKNNGQEHWGVDRSNGEGTSSKNAGERGNTERHEQRMDREISEIAA